MALLLQAAINTQINRELASFYAYWSIAAWFETTPYSGFAHWMHHQSKEEMEHAMRFFNYLKERKGILTLLPLEQPKTEFQTPLEAFEIALAQEEKISQHIRDLYFLAQKERDPETVSFLNEFLNEQIEEEKTVGDFVDKLRLAQDNVAALLQIDAQAAERKEA